MPSTSSRRRFLLTAVANSLFVSGCLEDQGDSDSAHGETPTETGASPTPTSSPTPTETPTETPEPTPTDVKPATPREEPPTPSPDSHAHDVLKVGVDASARELERPDATAYNDSFQMAYLQSASDLDKLDQGTLDDDGRTFLDDTDFDTQVVVVVWTSVPSYGSEPYVTGVFRQSDHVETRIWLKERRGLHAEGHHLVYVRVPSDGDPPDNATVLIENNLYDDYRPVEFGTTNEG